MSFRTLIYEKRDDAAWITLNRPAVLNAYNTAMRDELFEVLSAVRDDTDVRALVLRGAGRAFCGGADLTEFGTAPSPVAARRIRFSRDVWALFNDLEVPTIASVHGFALGTGLEMALLCDLRIVAEGTELGLPEVRLGLIPGAGGTQTLPRVCGLGTALSLLLTGRRIDATDAYRVGLVSWVVPADDLEPQTEQIVRDIVTLDARAVRAVRRAVRTGIDLPLEEGLRLEARLAEQL
ncbi:MAG: hypothetical protein GEU73_07890 [Chloroflexi bacterium]|nr:hypothetical protein [Chloroflexota bacterium]